MQEEYTMGYYALLFPFSREPAACPGGVVVDFPDGSGTEFEVARVTSCNEVPSAAQSPPVDFASSL